MGDDLAYSASSSGTAFLLELFGPVPFRSFLTISNIEEVQIDFNTIWCILTCMETWLWIKGSSSLSKIDSPMASRDSSRKPSSQGSLKDKTQATYRKTKETINRYLHPADATSRTDTVRPITPQSLSLEPPSPSLSGRSFDPNEPIAKITLLLLHLELYLTMSNVLYARDSSNKRRQDILKATVGSMVEIWLDTNMAKEARHYEADSFTRTDKPNYSPWPSWPPRRPRQKRPVCWPEARAEALHVIDGLDHVLDDDYRGERAKRALRNIDSFLGSLQKSKKKHYCIFLGAKNVNWWYSEEWTRREGTWYSKVWDQRTFWEGQEMNDTN